jgi:hypothetical protein
MISTVKWFMPFKSSFICPHSSCCSLSFMSHQSCCSSGSMNLLPLCLCNPHPLVVQSSAAALTNPTSCSPHVAAQHLPRLKAELVDVALMMRLHMLVSSVVVVGRLLLVLYECPGADAEPKAVSPLQVAGPVSTECLERGEGATAAMPPTASPAVTATSTSSPRLTRPPSIHRVCPPFLPARFQQSRCTTPSKHDASFHRHLIFINN